jgi:hypothetical protein
MAWARIDDNFPDHPKIVAAGPICALIQIRAICYCCRYLTDGRIPIQAVPGLLTGLELVDIVEAAVGNMASLGRNASEINWPERMVAHGLWDVIEDGRCYLVHDFLRYNFAKSAIEKRRKDKRSAGKKGANIRWGKEKTPIASAIAPAMTDGMLPIPIPIPISNKNLELQIHRGASTNGADAPAPPMDAPDQQFIEACPEPYRTAWLDAAWWISLKDGYPGVALYEKASQYLSHELAKAPHRRQRNVRAGFRAWVATADRWRQQELDRKAARR